MPHDPDKVTIRVCDPSNAKTWKETMWHFKNRHYPPMPSQMTTT